MKIVGQYLVHAVMFVYILYDRPVGSDVLWHLFLQNKRLMTCAL